MFEGELTVVRDLNLLFEVEGSCMRPCLEESVESRGYPPGTRQKRPIPEGATADHARGRIHKQGTSANQK